MASGNSGSTLSGTSAGSGPSPGTPAEGRQATADAASRDLDLFAYVVSHDLRAALRAVDFFGQELKDTCKQGLGPAGESHLQKILGARQRMVRIIDSLMAWYHLGRGEMRPVDLDVAALVADIVEPLREGAPARVVEVRVESGLKVRGDTRLVRAILEELLGNAWKFTGRRPAALIEVGQVEAGGVRAVFVRDNGAGFSMAYATGLFTRARRLHTQDEFDGNGLGLLGVHRAVERQGGRVWAEAVEGQGATFYFTLGASS